MLDERRDLLAPLAQRRQPQPDDVEAVEEVFAEAPLGHEGFEVGVGGGDDADVHLDGLRLAEAVDFAGLEEPQELGLHSGPISPISSRNRVPPAAARMTPSKPSGRR